MYPRRITLRMRSEPLCNGEMNVLDELVQAGERAKKVVTEADGCGEVKRTRAIPSTAQMASISWTKGLSPSRFLEFVASVKIDDLTEQA